MKRLEQYSKFNQMVELLFGYARLAGIPIRYGEAHRPYFVAEKYAKEGKGIIKSKHRWSLAVDIWITDSEIGNKILWKDDRYKTLGDFWKFIGGKWGGNFKKPYDPYHFEFPERPN